ARVKRRGWLVRRMLLAADLLGLVVAFTLVERLFGSGSVPANVYDEQAEFLLFLAAIPGWIVVAKLYGLYERDEERTDHSTADDFAGVFHMVTVCTWIFSVGAYLTGLAHPTAPKLVLFWAAAIGFVSLGGASTRATAR